MTDLFFGLKQNSLTLQTFQAGVLIEQQDGQQNFAAPNVGRFHIFAVDSADTGKLANFVDRTWLDQGEGIGIVDGDDETIRDRKGISGDEVLGIQVSGFQTKTANLILDQVSSIDGAQFRIKVFKLGIEVDSQILTASGNGRQALNFSSQSAFDEIQISAADDDTRFTFRSISLPNATPQVLSFGQKTNKADIQVLQDGNVLAQSTASQNDIVPNVGRFRISAIDSLDTGKAANFVDRTFFDQGEGIGIADGDDGNSNSRKRIDGDEILGISFEDTFTTDALIKVDRISSIDGAAIQIQAFRAGVSVATEIFTLGSGTLSGANTLTFGSATAFDSLQISAADADTQFTFRSVDLPGAFTL